MERNYGIKEWVAARALVQISLNDSPGLTGYTPNFIVFSKKVKFYGGEEPLEVKVEVNEAQLLVDEKIRVLGEVWDAIRRYKTKEGIPSGRG